MRLTSSARESRGILRLCILSKEMSSGVGMGLGPRTWELDWMLMAESETCFLTGDLFTKNKSTLTICFHNLYSKTAPPPHNGNYTLNYKMLTHQYALNISHFDNIYRSSLMRTWIYKYIRCYCSCTMSMSMYFSFSQIIA